MRKLSLGEVMACVSSLVLTVFMFFSWYAIEVSGDRRLHTTGASGPAPAAWQTLDWISIVIALTISLPLTLAWSRLTDSRDQLGPRANAVVAILGGISFVLILYRLVDPPGVGPIAGTPIDLSPTFAIFAGLAAAAGIVIGGCWGARVPRGAGTKS